MGDEQDTDANAQATIDSIASAGEGGPESAATAQMQSNDSAATGTGHPYNEQLARELDRLTAVLTDALAARFGAHWRLEQQESRELAVSGARCAYAWFGHIELSPTGEFLLAAVPMLGPRIALTVYEQQAGSATTESGGDQSADAG